MKKHRIACDSVLLTMIASSTSSVIGSPLECQRKNDSRQTQAVELLLVEVGRILMVEACEAEVVALAGLKHALVREECEGVGVDELAYLLH